MDSRWITYGMSNPISKPAWRYSIGSTPNFGSFQAAKVASSLPLAGPDEGSILGIFELMKVLPWVVVGAGGLGAGKTSGAGTRGVSLDVVIGGRTGHSDTNGGESSDNRSKIHADCGPAENPSL